MKIRQRVSTLLIFFIVSSFLFLASPEMGNAGAVPVDPQCCQIFTPNCPVGEDQCCRDITEVFTPEQCDEIPLGSVQSGICIEPTGFCSGFEPEARDIPTLSYWGLFAAAVVLGVVGFIYVRRRKAAV